MNDDKCWWVGGHRTKDLWNNASIYIYTILHEITTTTSPCSQILSSHISLGMSGCGTVIKLSLLVSSKLVHSLPIRDIFIQQLGNSITKMQTKMVIEGWFVIIQSDEVVRVRL